MFFFFFFSSRRRHTIFKCDWSSDVCSSDLQRQTLGGWSLIPVFTVRTGLPFSIMDSTNTLGGNSGVPSGIPRYTPNGTITSMDANGSTPSGNPNEFNLLTLPGADSTCNPAWLGCIETFGPFPANMTARNAFRGPSAWNADFALGKSFQLTERMSLDFRAEMFNIFNHHNMYVNGYVNDATGSGSSFTVVGKKGGLGSLAGSSIVTGNPSDERRFGQFALRLNF